MYRLAELSDSRRRQIGWGLLFTGLVTLVAGVIWLHVASLGSDTDAGAFDWIPRGALSKGLGYLVIFGATQMLVAGSFLVWVLNQPMTWARAMFAATMTFVELVIIFGMVPSEWLNYAQTDLEWSAQRDALTIPSFLVLGNQVGISYAAVKDAISMGYHVVMLAGAAVFAIRLQKMRQGRPPSAVRAEPRSPYGRPLVRGGS